MKIKLLLLVLAGSLAFVACKKEGCTDSTATNYDEKADEDDGSCTYDTTTTDTTTDNGGSTTDTTSTNGGTTDTTSTGGTTDTTSTGGGNPSTVSEYWFSDDNIKCTPYTQNPTINNSGILSVVSNPCQSSSAKLDGYFKFGSRPSAGTYTIAHNGTSVHIPTGTTEFSMIFYQHDSKNWYAQSGSVILTVNASDATKLDMNWSNVEMISEDSTTVQFSGTLLGL